MDAFFSTLAQVAGGLLAIGFITFQIRVDYWQKDRLRHMIAIRTLGEFLMVMSFSLLCLAYPGSWRLFSVVMGLVVVVSVTSFQRVCWTRQHRLTRFELAQMRLSPIADLEALYLFATAAVGGIDWLPPLLIWLLFSRSAQSWSLLTPPSE
jgi:hypothetical protein